jgi:hypothetical protein
MCIWVVEIQYVKTDSAVKNAFYTYFDFDYNLSYQVKNQ